MVGDIGLYIILVLKVLKPFFSFGYFISTKGVILFNIIEVVHQFNVNCRFLKDSQNYLIENLKMLTAVLEPKKDIKKFKK